MSRQRSRNEKALVFVAVHLRPRAEAVVAAVINDSRDLRLRQQQLHAGTY